MITVGCIKFLWNKIKRYHKYGKLGLNTYDDRYEDWIVYLRHKLSATYSIILDKHNPQSIREYRSLKLCLRICDRLSQDFYHINLDEYYKKWGKPNLEYYPVETDNKIIYQLIDINKFKLTPEELQQSQDELLIATEKDNNHKDRDTRILFMIMSKYYSTWWQQ